MLIIPVFFSKNSIYILFISTLKYLVILIISNDCFDKKRIRSYPESFLFFIFDKLFTLILQIQSLQNRISFTVHYPVIITRSEMKLECSYYILCLFVILTSFIYFITKFFQLCLNIQRCKSLCLI